jgi:hypothetical protein
MCIESWFIYSDCYMQIINKWLADNFLLLTNKSIEVIASVGEVMV